MFAARLRYRIVTSAFAICLLVIVFCSLPAVTSAEASVVLLFGYNLESLDDRIPGLYTTSIFLELYNPTNLNFWGVLLYPDPLYPNLTFNDPIFSNSQTKSWIHPQSGISNQRSFWPLQSNGDFPNDRFDWNLVIALNVTIGDLRLPVSYVPPDVDAKWVIIGPEITKISERALADPHVATIVNRLYDSMLKQGLTDWYVLHVAFSRHPADIERFSYLFLLPAYGLLVLFVTATVVSILLWRKGSPLSLGIALSLFLGSALFSFPFVLSINQYAPPSQPTWVEKIFYFDILLALAGTGVTLVSQYFRPAKDEA
jgi:hypothetical protein